MGPAAGRGVRPSYGGVMADRITMSRETTAAPDRVWAVLTDLDAAAATLSGVTAIEKLTPGPYRVGTRWHRRAWYPSG